MKAIKLCFLSVAFSILICGCGHKHVFKEATCTEPKTCLECGATEGEALGHTWIEADCLNPKTCSACGLTEGEALGHALEMGICPNCGEIVGEEYYTEISHYVTNIKLYADSMTKLINEADFSSIYSLYAYFDGARTSHMKNLKDELTELIDYCGSHPELEDVKKTAKSWKNKLPTTVSQNVDSLNAFYNAYVESLKLSGDFYMEVAGFAERFTK